MRSFVVAMALVGFGICALPANAADESDYTDLVTYFQSVMNSASQTAAVCEYAMGNLNSIREDCDDYTLNMADPYFVAYVEAYPNDTGYALLFQLQAYFDGYNLYKVYAEDERGEAYTYALMAASDPGYWDDAVSHMESANSYANTAAFYIDYIDDNRALCLSKLLDFLGYLEAY